MDKTMLVTRPRYDDATEYLFYYASLIIEEAENKNIKVIDLKRPRLTKEIASEIIMEKCPRFLFFNAHGDDDAIYGDKIDGQEEPLIKEGINHKLLDSKIVYARACSSAISLGKSCSNGCFIGYNVLFSFFIDQRWSAKPANDKTANLFLEPSNLIASSLVRGFVVKEAVEKSSKMTKKNILELLKKDSEPGASASAMLLWNNLEGLEVIGDDSMRI